MTDSSSAHHPASDLFPPGTRIGTYIIEDLIRESRNSLVFHAQSSVTQGKFVFKYIRPEVGADIIENHLEMNHQLANFPNVAIGFDFVQVSDSYGYFMHYYADGDLFDFFTSHTLSESEIRNISRRILESLLCLHAEGIVHRNIKPENILLDGKGVEPDAYLAGFTFTTRMPGDGSKLTEPMGTTWYMAPEIHHGAEYDQAVDMWAFGVTLYAILTEIMPFPNPTTHYAEFLDAIQHSEYTMGLEGVSDDARDLIDGLLRPEPHLRLTAEQALNHPFYANI